MIHILPHIRELIIIRPASYLMPTHTLSQALQSLPKSLVKLKLVCLNSQHAFFATTPTIPRLRHDLPLWGIADTWPELNSLTLRTGLPYGEPLINLHPFGETQIRQLPLTLTELSLCCFDSEGDNFTPSLPRGLLILETERLHELSDLMVADLPPSLTHLIGFCLDHVAAEKLPATLEEADFTVEYYTWPADDRPILGAPKLRTISLSTIEVINSSGQDDPIAFFSRLPPTLEKLETQMEWFPKLGPKELAALPRALTDLYWPSDFDWDEIERENRGQMAWPPNLRHLFIGRPGDISVLALPSKLVTLQELNLDNWEEDVQTVLSDLPATLQTIVCSIPMGYQFGVTKPLRFPKGLTSLTINLYQGSWLKNLPSGLLDFTTQHLFGDPEHLIAELDYLPSDLRDIRIEWTEMRLTGPRDSPFSQCRNLRYLDVGACARFSPHFLRLLSRKLEHLVVDLIDFDHRDIPHLPPALLLADFSMDLDASYLTGWPEKCHYRRGTLNEALAKQYRESVMARAQLYPDPRVAER